MIAYDEFDLPPGVSVHLTSAAAVELASLFLRFNNIITLELDLSDCCSVAVETLVTSITHKTLERLKLSGICLTSKAAAALGQSLPEMSSLQELELTGVNGGMVQAEDMEKLFGGFSRPLPLHRLTFSDFSIRGCLASLAKIFLFLPSLRVLKLEELDMDEHDQCGLLESGFICNKLTALSIEGKDTVRSVTCHLDENELTLDGVGLTLAVAVALSRLLPEMSSLRTLKLTGVDGSILQTKEMETLFGGFNKSLPLIYLTFSDFSHICCTAKVKTIASFTHKTLEQLHLDGISLTPAVAAALGELLPEMSSLQTLKLTGVDGSIVETKEMVALFGGFNKQLPLSELTFSGFSVRSCLAPFTKSFRFFPNLRELNLGHLRMDVHNLSVLLENLRVTPNLKKLSIKGNSLSQVHCCTVEVNPIASATNKSLEQLHLDGICLTPAVASALGQFLPEMPSLKVLKISGLYGSILEAKEIEALFGGFNKILPLSELSCSGFNVRGCLAPLTKSFRFLPNLRELNLGQFNMDEQNFCLLLDSLRFIPNLKELSVNGKSLSQAHCCTAEVNPIESVTYKTLEQLHLVGMKLTPAVVVALGRSLPEMPSLRELRLSGVDGSVLEAKEMEALFGGFNKTLPLCKFTFSGFSVSGCLAPLTKSFRFFPNLRELNLGEFNGEFSMNEKNVCHLLDSLRFIPNLKKLSVKGKSLSEAHCCTAEVNPIASATHKTLEQLYLDRISLTPAVAAALGRSLAEMPSLKVLRLTGVVGSILEAKEMEALFGGFSKTLPLSKLTFSDFSLRGCLAPLTKSFRFFPNLREFNLGGFNGEFNMDEQNLCLLLDSLRFIRNLETLSVKGKLLSQAHCCTAEVNPIASVTHKTLEELHLDVISLSPAVAAALGRSLPEMPSLEELRLIGVDGSVLEAKELGGLFGGFNKTVPLRELSFSGFSVSGCLAPLTKSFRFFPNLRQLNLGGFNGEFNMDEQNLCLLLDSLRFIPNLEILSVKGKSLSQAHCCTVEVNPAARVTHKTLEELHLDGISLTPTVAAAIGRSLPEMPSLKVLKLTGVDGSVLKAKEMEALFGGLSKTLPLSELSFSGFSVRGCLAPFTKILHFFPSLRELNLQKLNMDEHDLCDLLNALSSTAEVNTTASITCKALEKLNLIRISLTSSAAAALGRSLPEMSSLQKLRLTGVDGNILEAKEMEALFGGFNKTLPLTELTFTGFSVRGCLAPLTKSLQFFPNLTHLNLGKLNMDEHDLCDLQESLQFIPDLSMLNLSRNPLDQAVRSIVPHVSNLLKLQRLFIVQTGLSEEDFNYVIETVRQALPELTIYGDS
ncbi:uncharacterized protein LOC144648626 [Oculina patagonica]